MYYLFYQNKPLKESLSSILIITVLALGGGWIFFHPKPAEAQAEVIEVGSVPLQTIQDLLKWAWEKVAAAYHASADWISARVNAWRQSEDILERSAIAALEVALRIALSMITNEIIKWIQGGGEPRFINDWRGFLRDVADKAGGTFVDKYLGMGWLCEEFDIDIRIALLDVPRFEDRVRCTISDIVDNVGDFANDFSKGSWKGWIKLTEPQNNLYGGYLIAREEKLKREAAAKEAAEQEAAAGKGFWSLRECVRGYTTDTNESCSSKDDCDNLESNPTFVCERDISTTPGTIISDVVTKAVTQDLTILENQIGDLADSFGPYLAPYIAAIASALVNRVLQEGLNYVEGLGPSSDDPDAPLPEGRDVDDVDTTVSDAIDGQNQASSLAEQQELLKENLEFHLLTEQEANLVVLESIEDIQNEILDTIVEIFKNCTLPSWATAEVIDTVTSVDPVTNDDKTTETYQITVTDIGSVTIKKETTSAGSSQGSSSSILYYDQQNNPQINAELTALENDIAETNQRIADAADAIAATNGYYQTAQEYIDLYENTLQPPTDEEQAALDEKEQLMDTAETLAIEKGEIAVRVDPGTIETFEELNTETQSGSMEVVQESSNLIFARGISEEYPQAGTYYGQKSDAKSTRIHTSAHLSDCLSSSD